MLCYVCFHYEQAEEEVDVQQMLCYVCFHHEQEEEEEVDVKYSVDQQVPCFVCFH